MYDINIPLHNCRVDFEYGIFHIYSGRPYLNILVWWVVFLSNPPCFGFPVSSIQIITSVLPGTPSNKILYPLPWTLFCLTVVVIITSSAVLPIFIGVGGWVNQVHWYWCVGVHLFSHCVQVHIIMLLQQNPQRVSLFYILFVLVNFMMVGGVDIFRVGYLRSKALVPSSMAACPWFR